MTERLVMTAILIALGFVTLCIFKFWRVRRATITASYDPLMVSFNPGIPGLVYFTADYCAPCKTQQQPAIHRLVEQIGNTGVQVIKVDVESNPDIASRWGILSLPTTIILDSNGKPHDINHGVTSTEKLKRQLEAAS